MIKFLRTVLLLLFTIQAASAQKQGRHTEEFFIDTVQPLTLRLNQQLPLDASTADISDFLHLQFRKELSGFNDIVLENVKAGPLATHYTFRQTYKDIPVYRSEIRVHIDKAGKLFMISALLFDCSGANTSEKHYNSIKPSPDPSLIKSRNKVIFHNGEFAQAAYRYILKDENSSPELILGENGTQLYLRDLRLYKNSTGKDSIASGYIFNPDPLTTARKYYGRPFIDSNDTALPNLDSQRQIASVKVYFENDTFWLRNRYMRYMDFSGPYQGKMWSLVPEYFYSRSDDMFEAFNSFYHISMMQNYVESLGFGGLLDTLHVDPHALNNDDNSFFDYNDTIPTLSYGDGGVDDAEDADVILHEFTHCMSYYGSPNTANGSQRLAMEEGNADYIAASNSRSIDTFRFAEVYTWDGHNQFWPGRVSITSKKYPDFAGNAHLDGEIWAHAMVLIMQKLGKDYTDSLLFNSLFLQASNLSMPTMAQTIVLLDSMLRGGKNYVKIYESFVEKKILAWHVSIGEKLLNEQIQLFSSADFASGKADAEIVFPLPFSGKVHIYDLSGRVLEEREIGAESRIKINPGTYAPGLYFVSISNSTLKKSFKLIRY